MRRAPDVKYDGPGTASDGLRTSDDLDLFGKASLFHLLCVANTPMGVQTLRQWLLHPADPAEIASRQEAVREGHVLHLAVLISSMNRPNNAPLMIVAEASAP